jgi:tRNA dimethylallyltransferase
MRSVETALLTGHRLSDLHRTRSRASEIRGRYLVVDPGTRLADRIEQRFDLMMADGWTEEVERLMRTVDESAPAWKASGYSVMREMIAGRIARQEARERVIIETRQYAKRQRTWFRHQLDESATTRVDPDDTGTERLARGWWEEKGRGP